MSEKILSTESNTSLLGSMPSSSSPAYADRSLQTAFDYFAEHVTCLAGSPMMFCLAIVTVLVWAGSGPLFHFSETWQLVVNTGTTIATCLMVFLIQQSRIKYSVAVHLKLKELLAANCEVSNRMIVIEDMDEQDLRDVADFYVRLSQRANDRVASKEVHSIDEDAAEVLCKLEPDLTDTRERTH